MPSLSWFRRYVTCSNLTNFRSKKHEAERAFKVQVDWPARESSLLKVRHPLKDNACEILQVTSKEFRKRMREVRVRHGSEKTGTRHMKENCVLSMRQILTQKMRMFAGYKEGIFETRNRQARACHCTERQQQNTGRRAGVL